MNSQLSDILVKDSERAYRIKKKKKQYRKIYSALPACICACAHDFNTEENFWLENYLIRLVPKIIPIYLFVIAN